jgi:hypothetical protein
MLGLSRSIANRVGTLSVSGEAADVVYNQGDTGVSSNSIIYNVDNTVFSAETSSDAFLYLNPSTYDGTTTFSDIVTEVEGATYGGQSDWEVAEANQVLDASDISGWALSDVSLDNIVQNYIYANYIFPSTVKTNNTASVVSLLASHGDNHTINYFVVFKNGSTDNFFIAVKTIPPGNAIQRTNSLFGGGTGWTTQPSTFDFSLGDLISAQDASGNYVNVITVATNRFNEAEQAYARTPVPQVPINVYSENQTIPNGFDPGVLMAYGDILEPNRLLDGSVERYVAGEDVKSPVDYPNSTTPTGDDGGYAMTSFLDLDSSEPTISAITTTNKQISVYVIFGSQVKPPDPWYDSLSGEVIKARINIIGFRNEMTVSNLLGALSVRNSDSIIESNASTTKFTATIEGVTTYFAYHKFTFDVSDVPVYATDQEKTNFGISGTAKVSDLSYDSVGSFAEEKHESQIFRIEDIQFGSNKRIYGPVVKGPKTFSKIVVPTLGGSFGVGDDTTSVMFDSVGGTPQQVERSLKTGVDAPSHNNDQFNFEFDASTTQDVSIETSLDEATVPFDSRFGAFNDNSEFVYIDTSDQQTDISGDVSISIDKSLYPSDTNISLDLNIRVDSDDVALGVSPTVSTVGDVDTYNWNFSKIINLVGASDFSVKQTTKLVVSVANGSQADGEYQLTVLNASTLSATEDNTQLGSPPPETAEEDLTGQTIAPIPRYNKY